MDTVYTFVFTFSVMAPNDTKRHHKSHHHKGDHKKPHAFLLRRFSATKTETSLCGGVGKTTVAASFRFVSSQFLGERRKKAQL